MFARKRVTPFGLRKERTAIGFECPQCLCVLDAFVIEEGEEGEPAEILR